jgi:hypothetical protein
MVINFLQENKKVKKDKIKTLLKTKGFFMPIKIIYFVV